MQGCGDGDAAGGLHPRPTCSPEGQYRRLCSVEEKSHKFIKISYDMQVECETRLKAIELKEICVDIDIQLPREECRKEEREECR